MEKFNENLYIDPVSLPKFLHETEKPIKTEVIWTLFIGTKLIPNEQRLKFIFILLKILINCSAVHK